jgi:hypothetical protein
MSGVIEQFPKLPSTLFDQKPLGSGLWGDVYDLGDGTVLKLAKQGAGIGDVQEKIKREGLTLQTLAAFQDMQDIIPTLIGYGEIPEQEVFLRDRGYTHWLRTQKMEGSKLSANAIDTLSNEQKNQCGLSIGHALGRLHQAMMAVPPKDYVLPDNPYEDLTESVGNNTLLQQALSLLTEEWVAIPAEIKSCPAHGDFNISNLLFKDLAKDLRVSAVLDHAETGYCYPEKDIADIVKDCPSLLDSVVLGYEMTTEFSLSPHRLVLGLAENALYGAAIAQKAGNTEEYRLYSTLLVHYLNRAGHKITMPVEDQAGIKNPHDLYEVELMEGAKKPCLIRAWPLTGQYARLQPLIDSGHIVVIGTYDFVENYHILHHPDVTADAQKMASILNKSFGGARLETEEWQFNDLFWTKHCGITVRDAEGRFIDRHLKERRKNNSHGDYDLLLNGKIRATLDVMTGTDFNATPPAIRAALQSGEITATLVKTKVTQTAVLAQKDSIHMGRELLARYFNNEAGYTPLVGKAWTRRIGELLGYTQADTDFFMTINAKEIADRTSQEELHLRVMPLLRHVRATTMLPDLDIHPPKLGL